METALGFCLALACLTEGEWRPVRREYELSHLPSRVTLTQWQAENAEWQKDVGVRLSFAPADENARALLDDARARSALIEEALLAHPDEHRWWGYPPRDPWKRLHHLHRTRDLVGEGAFYHGPWPGPVPVNALPWCKVRGND